MRLKFLIFTEKVFLIGVEQDTRTTRTYATEEETRQAFGQDYYNYRDDILYETCRYWKGKLVCAS